MVNPGDHPEGLLSGSAARPRTHSRGQELRFASVFSAGDSSSDLIAISKVVALLESAVPLISDQRNLEMLPDDELYHPTIRLVGDPSPKSRVQIESTELLVHDGIEGLAIPAQ